MSDGHYLRIFEKIMILHDAWLMVTRLQSDIYRASDFFERTMILMIPLSNKLRTCFALQ